MATVTLGVQTPSTANVADYPADAFTPALDDFLVAFVHASGTLVPGGGTMTDDLGVTWTLAATGNYNAGGWTASAFVRSLLATAVPIVCTYHCTADPGTGAMITVLRAAGADNYRAASFGQGLGPSAPAVVMPQAILTGNAVVGAMGEPLNPPAATPPAGWTEAGEIGMGGSPIAGQEACFRNSGETGTTITWGSATHNNWGALVVELSLGGGPPPATISLPGIVSAEAHGKELLNTLGEPGRLGHIDTRDSALGRAGISDISETPTP